MLFFTSQGYTQDITGDWTGQLEVQTISLRIVYHITADGEHYTATMDSPDQGANGIPVTGVKLEKYDLAIDMTDIGAKYTGVVNEDFTSIEGTFTQGGQDLPLVLTKTTKAALKEMEPKRPQEPKPPFPYYSEDVVFKNQLAQIELAGTLTLPDTTGQYPVVVLISGSGPQDRNEEMLNHKPFLVLADHLTRHGIGVLRYDDRGVAKSKGDFSTATSKDFATDAFAAVQYLQKRKEVRKDKIGLVGHSEGGLIAPMVAAAQPDDIGFIVLLAGPGIASSDLLLEQIELIATSQGMGAEKLKEELAITKGAYDIMQQKNELAVETKLLEAYFAKAFSGLTEEELAKVGSQEKLTQQQISALQSPWFRYFITYNPRENLMNTRCPVFAINGSKDLQVAPKSNLKGIREALEASGNKQYDILEIEGLNHLFQTSETGNPSEYGSIEETFNPEALDLISGWIMKIVK